MPESNDPYIGQNINAIGPLSTIKPYNEYVKNSLEPIGVWRDIRIAADGTVLEFTDWKHNLVVTSFANLLALLTMNNSSYVGVQYLALGTGLSAWDSGGVPAPALTDTTLVTEPSSGNFRKAVTAQMVDASNNVTASITNRILISATFNMGEANGSLREWGLFGGNATPTANSGIMIDHVTHGIITKDAGGNDFTLVRQITLIF
jgi:hypothetical protein